jgi:hypothetical protein
LEQVNPGYQIFTNRSPLIQALRLHRLQAAAPRAVGYPGTEERRQVMRALVRCATGVVAAAMWLGATAGVALAQGGYGAVAGEQSGGGSGSGPGGLPFTGVDLLGYVVVAGGIIAAGMGLRMIAGRQSRL